jgi:hypothetical protein
VAACVAGAAAYWRAEAGSDGFGELAFRGPAADERGDGVVTGAAAGGELAAADARAAALARLPWPGATASRTTAATAATTRSVTPAAVIPVRKLTSSSQALTAARTPGPEPAARCCPPYTTPDDID